MLGLRCYVWNVMFKMLCLMAIAYKLIKFGSVEKSVTNYIVAVLCCVRSDRHETPLHGRGQSPPGDPIHQII